MKRTFWLLIVMVLLLAAGCAAMNDAITYYNRGVSYAHMGQYDQAISDYTMALAIRPRFAEAYGNRGIAYEYKGQYDQAISDYNKALEINPRY
ncbi:MAG: tetratricopeptide repeat protein, partial [Woeseia sp.]